MKPVMFKWVTFKSHNWMEMHPSAILCWSFTNDIICGTLKKARKKPKVYLALQKSVCRFCSCTEISTNCYYQIQSAQESSQLSTIKPIDHLGDWNDHELLSSHLAVSTPFTRCWHESQRAIVVVLEEEGTGKSAGKCWHVPRFVIVANNESYWSIG